MASKRLNITPEIFYYQEIQMHKNYVHETYNEVYHNEFITF
jgi:hypothetical protein